MKPNELVIDFEKSIGPWLGRTVKMVDYHLHEAIKEAGLDLTKEQMVVLKKLHDEDGLNQNELAYLTYRDKSSLARLLSKMEKKKFIVRKPSASDKRVNQVFVTSYGKEIFESAKPFVGKLIKRMEHAISETEKQQIISILKKVQTNLS
ncbi:MarR family winged helix-turn-helix transcriptional regulator [Aggregatimonas sangjinii]|nr:MarR family transcriptional regulator [Aggregatimonas sangjinii]